MIKFHFLHGLSVLILLFSLLLLQVFILLIKYVKLVGFHFFHVSDLLLITVLLPAQFGLNLVILLFDFYLQVFLFLPPFLHQRFLDQYDLRHLLNSRMRVVSIVVVGVAATVVVRKF